MSCNKIGRSSEKVETTRERKHSEPAVAWQRLMMIKMIMITNFVKEVSEFRNFLHETKEYIFGCIFRQRILWVGNFLKLITY